MRIDENPRLSVSPEARSRLSANKLDADEYLSDLEGFDMDEAQKRELLAILWDIMERFVRLGIDVKICERIFEDGEIDFATSQKPLESLLPPSTTEKPSGGKQDER